LFGGKVGAAATDGARQEFCEEAGVGSGVHARAATAVGPYCFPRSGCAFEYQYKSKPCKIHPSPEKGLLLFPRCVVAWLTVPKGWCTTATREQRIFQIRAD
jgi:hypothetical protein